MNKVAGVVLCGFVITQPAFSVPSENLTEDSIPEILPDEIDYVADAEDVKADVENDRASMLELIEKIEALINEYQIPEEEKSKACIRLLKHTLEKCKRKLEDHASQRKQKKRVTSKKNIKSRAHRKRD